VMERPLYRDYTTYWVGSSQQRNKRTDGRTAANTTMISSFSSDHKPQLSPELWSSLWSRSRQGCGGSIPAS
jgi:hypothetical protein